MNDRIVYDDIWMIVDVSWWMVDRLKDWNWLETFVSIPVGVYEKYWYNRLLSDCKIRKFVHSCPPYCLKEAKNALKYTRWGIRFYDFLALFWWMMAWWMDGWIEIDISYMEIWKWFVAYLEIDVMWWIGGKWWKVDMIEIDISYLEIALLIWKSE